MQLAISRARACCRGVASASRATTALFLRDHTNPGARSLCISDADAPGLGQPCTSSGVLVTFTNTLGRNIPPMGVHLACIGLACPLLIMTCHNELSGSEQNHGLQRFTCCRHESAIAPSGGRNSAVVAHAAVRADQGNPAC